MTEKHLTDTRFDQFELAPDLLRGITEAGFTHCTPIQAASLPPALAGRDVAGQAQTGTGKTAAFLVAVLHRLIQHPPPPGRRPNQPRALVVAPTRELAIQIHKDAEALSRHTGFVTHAVYGGTGYEQQRDQVAAGVDILIGTPGRLIDYFKQGVYDLKAIQVVVLDEADRMFDLGFIKDVRYLFRRMPPPSERLGLLFSATLSFRVTELAYEHMNNPEAVETETDHVTAEQVEEICYMVANEEKIALLLGLLKAHDPQRTILFVNTKREAERVWGFLEGNQIKTAILSGDVPQRKRMRLLTEFQQGELPVLVATDVAARGLHIPDVTHVINFDLPEDAEDYVHRIGRTARAGAAGEAISFVCETYAFSLPDIEAFIGHKVPVGAVSDDLLAEVDPKSRVFPPKEERDRRRQNKGKPGRPGRHVGAKGRRPGGSKPRSK